MSQNEMDEFSYECEEDREEDNVKLFQYIVTPDGERHWLDHTPYCELTKADLAAYVAFYKVHGRFPTRQDIDSCGPIHSEDLVALTA